MVACGKGKQFDNLIGREVQGEANVHEVVGDQGNGESPQKGRGDDEQEQQPSPTIARFAWLTHLDSLQKHVAQSTSSANTASRFIAARIRRIGLLPGLRCRTGPAPGVSTRR